MAREAVLRDTNIKTSRRYTCSGSVTIPKGTALALSADNTLVASTGTGDIFMGFAHATKDGSDTLDTSICADKGAVYDVYASGSITKGCKVKTAAPGNYFMQCTAADVTSYGNIACGVALEDATAGEQINVEFFP